MGQPTPFAHSATKLRPLALVLPVTYTRKLADVTVAPAGIDAVLNRNNPARTSYPPHNGPARRTPKVVFAADAVAAPAGGYSPPAPMLLAVTSPSSAPPATANVNDPDDGAT